MDSAGLSAGGCELNSVGAGGGGGGVLAAAADGCRTGQGGEQDRDQACEAWALAAEEAKQSKTWQGGAWGPVPEAGMAGGTLAEVPDDVVGIDVDGGCSLGAGGEGRLRLFYEGDVGGAGWQRLAWQLVLRGDR